MLSVKFKKTQIQIRLWKNWILAWDRKLIIYEHVCPFKGKAFKTELKDVFWVFNRYKSQPTIKQNTNPRMKKTTNSLWYIVKDEPNAGLYSYRFSSTSFTPASFLYIWPTHPCLSHLLPDHPVRSRTSHSYTVRQLPNVSCFLFNFEKCKKCAGNTKDSLTNTHVPFISNTC